MTDFYLPVFAKSTIDGMVYEVAEWVQAKGWNDDRTFGDSIALLHEEASEALKAWRREGLCRWYTNTDGREIPLMFEDPPDYHNGKPEGVASEFADILIRLLDNCHRYGVDLFSEYKAKMRYNWTRAYRHGDQNL